MGVSSAEDGAVGGRPPRSVARLAAQRAIEHRDGGQLRRAAAWFEPEIRRGRPLVRWWWLGLYVAAVAPLFAHLSWLSCIKVDEEFVRTAWQVVAAVAALSFAVALFVIPASQSSDWRLSIREFVHEARIELFIHLNMAGLLVDWLVLLGVGYGGAEGWAGRWAALTVGLTIISIPVLFQQAISSMDPARMQRSVQRKVIRAVRESVGAEVRERLATVIVRQFAIRHGVDFAGFLFEPDQQQQHVVRAKSTGLIRDINLRRLHKIINSIREDAPTASIKIGTYVGRPAGERELLAVLPHGTSDATCTKVASCFTIDATGTRSTLDAELSRLRQGALSAIRNGQSDLFKQWSDLYRELLLAYPRAWQDYGERFDKGAASSLHPFELPQLSRVMDDLQEQFRQAVLGNHREIVESIDSLIFRLGLDSIRLFAGGLLTAVLGLTSRLQEEARETTGSELARAAYARQHDLLFSIIDHGIEPPLVRERFDESEQEAAAQACSDVFIRLRDTIKRLIDLERYEDAKSVTTRWISVLSHWDGDADDLAWRIELFDQHDDHSPDAQQRRAGLARQHHLAKLRDALIDQRRQHLFELSAWTLRRIEESSADGAEELFAFLVGHVGGATHRIAAARALLSADTALSDWILFTLPPRQAHFVGTDSLVLRTLALSLLMVAPSNGSSVAFPVEEWVDQYGDRLQDAIEKVNWDRWSSILPAATPPETTGPQSDPPVPSAVDIDRDRQQRRDALLRGLATAIEQFKAAERQALIQATPSPERVEWFLSLIREGVTDSRLADVLAGGVVELPVDQLAVPRYRAGPHQWINKDWFLEDCAVVNVDDVARELGTAVGRGETGVLFKALENATPSSSATGDFARDLSEAIEALRTRSLHPITVVGPVNWRLWRAADVQHADRDQHVPEGTGESMVHWIEGRIGEDVLVVEWPDWSGDRVVVADLPSYIELQRGIYDGGGTMLEQLQFYDEDAAVSLATENPQMMASDERQSVEARAEEIQTQALLRVERAVSTRIKDESAAVAVQVPAELQRDA